MTAHYGLFLQGGMFPVNVLVPTQARECIAVALLNCKVLVETFGRRDY